MPTNKNAQLRYQVLDRCFSDSHHKYSIDDLCRKVNAALSDMFGVEVSLRQIREDIKYMRDRMTYNAPIKTYPLVGRKCYYRYADPHFTIFSSELTLDDISKLQTTINMLSRFRGLPKHAWLEEVISNLEYRFGIKANSEQVVSFDQNDRLRGLEFLGDLIDAALKHQPLLITYMTFGGKKSTMNIHPYYVKQYNGRWFLYGLNDELDKISNLAMDRIQTFSMSALPFKKNDKYDFATYFDDVVGVTVPDDDTSIETIRLRFSSRRFPYVVSKPIHKSQTVTDADHCEIELKVRPTRELDQQVFSFIPDIEVVHPEWYRQKIRGKMEECLKKYLPVQKDFTDND